MKKGNFSRNRPGFLPWKCVYKGTDTRSHNVCISLSIGARGTILVHPALHKPQRSVAAWLHISSARRSFRVYFIDCSSINDIYTVIHSRIRTTAFSPADTPLLCHAIQQILFLFYSAQNAHFLQLKFMYYFLEQETALEFNFRCFSSSLFLRTPLQIHEMSLHSIG